MSLLANLGRVLASGEILPTVDESIANEPATPSMLMLSADLHWRRREWQAAIEAASRVLARKPKDFHALAILAGSYGHLQQIEAAHPYAKRLVPQAGAAPSTMRRNFVGNEIQPHNQRPAAIWSWGGSAYDKISRGIADSIEHCVLRLDPQPGEHVLALSTGTGWTSRSVARRGARRWNSTLRGAGCGVQSLYLFTTTAEDFFAALGYKKVDRAQVPEAIRNTRAFSSLCPSSSSVMVINLAG